MAKTQVKNRLAEIRKGRGVGAADLAARVRVSRQTIYAIEAGTYVPNTEVALNLARELEVTVEELFSLQQRSGDAAEPLSADVLSAAAPAR
jgi:putative molybdopterin biosynthesis protein